MEEHGFSGYTQFGMNPERARALCLCGFTTKPYLTTIEAAQAMLAEHGVRAPRDGEINCPDDFCADGQDPED